MKKGIKFRIYPNKKQQDLINQTSAMLSELKRNADFSFLKEVDSIALQQSLRDLDRGYMNFFSKTSFSPNF